MSNDILSNRGLIGSKHGGSKLDDIGKALNKGCIIRAIIPIICSIVITAQSVAALAGTSIPEKQKVGTSVEVVSGVVGKKMNDGKVLTSEQYRVAGRKVVNKVVAEHDAVIFEMDENSGGSTTALRKIRAKEVDRVLEQVESSRKTVGANVSKTSTGQVKARTEQAKTNVKTNAPTILDESAQYGMLNVDIEPTTLSGSFNWDGYFSEEFKPTKEQLSRRDYTSKDDVTFKIPDIVYEKSNKEAWSSGLLARFGKFEKTWTDYAKLRQEAEKLLKSKRINITKDGKYKVETVTTVLDSVTTITQEQSITEYSGPLYGNRVGESKTIESAGGLYAVIYKGLEDYITDGYYCEKLAEIAANQFDDIKGNEPWAPLVPVLVANNMIEGKTTKRFGGDDYITWYEANRIMWYSDAVMFAEELEKSFYICDGSKSEWNRKKKMYLTKAMTWGDAYVLMLQYLPGTSLPLANNLKVKDYEAVYRLIDEKRNGKYYSTWGRLEHNQIKANGITAKRVHNDWEDDVDAFEDDKKMQNKGNKQISFRTEMAIVIGQEVGYIDNKAALWKKPITRGEFIDLATRMMCRI